MIKASAYWLPVPQNIALFPAEEQVAWIAVLDAIRRGEPMGRNELRRRTGWGGSRADRFLGEVEEWAAGQSRAASGPLPGQSRAASGPLPGRSAKVKAGQSSETGPVAGQSRAASGPIAGRSRADRGPDDADRGRSFAASPPPKKEQKEEEQNSLSPTPLTERESVDAQEGPQEARHGAPSAGRIETAPPAGSERGGAGTGLSARLPARLVAALRDAGIEDEAALRARGDRELRYLHGVGEAGLATIRAAYPAERVSRPNKALELMQKMYGPKKRAENTEVADA